MTDFREIIEAARAENAQGIQMRAGKRYTTVAVRVEIARRFLGRDIGISTEIVHWATAGGDPVVIKATITDNTNGAILATGHAEEIRGAGNVNKTSALENAETSAIGRALAALGLAGGEFASANEMDGVTRKTEAKAETPMGGALRNAWRDAVEDSLPEGATPREKAQAYAAAICKDFADKGKKALANRWDNHAAMIGKLKEAHPDLHETVVDAYENRMMMLVSADGGND